MWWSIFHTVSFILVLPHVKCQPSSRLFWSLFEVLVSDKLRRKVLLPTQVKNQEGEQLFLLSVQGPLVGPACSAWLTEAHRGGPAPGVSLVLFGPYKPLSSAPNLSDSTLPHAPSPRLCLDLLPILFLAFGGIFSSLLGLLLLTMEIYCVLCAWKMNFHVRRGEQLPQAREIKLGL